MIDERQAAIYAQLHRQREQEIEDARIAAEMAAEYDGIEAKAEAKRLEDERLSEEAARLMASNGEASWEDERREREEADMKMARELAMSEELGQ
ncbi:hypothetical protein P7C70_g8900, partial [Phenoliferia sp. Uapishka_3]